MPAEVVTNFIPHQTFSVKNFMILTTTQEKNIGGTKAGVSIVATTQWGLVSFAARQMSLGQLAKAVIGGDYRDTFAYVVTPAIAAC